MMMNSIVIKCKDLPNKDLPNKDLPKISKEFKFYNFKKHTFGENLKYCLFSNKLYPNIHKDLKREVVKKNFTSSFKKTPLESSFYFVCIGLSFLYTILFTYTKHLSNGLPYSLSNNFKETKTKTKIKIINLVINTISVFLPFFLLFIFLKEQIKGVKNYLIFFSIMLACFLFQYIDKLPKKIHNSFFLNILFYVFVGLSLFCLIIYFYHSYLLFFALFKCGKKFLLSAFITSLIFGLFFGLFISYWLIQKIDEKIKEKNQKIVNIKFYEKIILIFITFFLVMIVILWCFVFFYIIFHLNGKFRKTTSLISLMFAIICFFNLLQNPCMQNIPLFKKIGISIAGSIAVFLFLFLVSFAVFVMIRIFITTPILFSNKKIKNIAILFFLFLLFFYLFSSILSKIYTISTDENSRSAKIFKTIQSMEPKDFV